MTKHSVGLILVIGGEVLLVKNTSKSGYAEEIYGVPAGRLELNENEKQAALRELKEETGLTCREEDLNEFPNNFYTAVLNRKEGPVEYTIRFFKVKKWSGELSLSDETIPEWYPISELNKLKLLPNVENAIKASLPPRP